MIKLADRVTDTLAVVLAWLTVAMALLTMAIVVLRYAFDQGTILLQETVMYLHAIVFMLAIPYALKVSAHVRVDLLYSRFSDQRKRLVDIIGHLFILMPVAAFVFVSSLPYVSASWRILERSTEVGGIPFVYLLKTLIPLMAALLFLQGLVEIARLLMRKS